MQHLAGTRGTDGKASRVVLVTGAASGIGLATARHLARAGWTVYGGFKSGGRSAPVPDQPSAPGTINWLPLDVTSGIARAGAVNTIERAHGRLDALINNAGIHASGPLEEMPEPTLREVMEVNFFAPINLTRECLPVMRRTGGGVILMISSLSALIGLPFDGAYAASKAALEGASESLSYELESFGIRVALLEPGAYATALTSREQPATKPSLYPAFERTRGARGGSGGGDPEEVAALILATLTAAAAPVRIPCGAQAAAVVERLRTLDDVQRRAFAMQVSGMTPP
jgi:NAD(P)-dependent dehydrogenase (short-subunit alcohol dehydrogenase family)